jgi:dTDP-4-amino-4,6-dideoxy-D-galactose acyltransferase
MSEEIISEHLDWDSQFFGIEISKIYVNNYDIDVIKNSVRSSIDSGAKLIYLIIPAEIDKKMIYSSHLIDDKVVYTKEIGNTGQFDNKISQYNATNVNEELYELAFESGKYSRFKLDKNLPSGSFEKLYSLWIERSVKGEICLQRRRYNPRYGDFKIVTRSW